MQAVCVRDCLIPVRGAVLRGETLDVDDPDASWMKHFKLLGAMSGPAQPVDIPVDVATAEYPVHAGGGYYRLSDGKTIKGRAEAEAAEKALSS